MAMQRYTIALPQESIATVMQLLSVMSGGNCVRLHLLRPMTGD